MRGFADELPHELLVEPHLPRLIQGDRAAELTAELLQPFAVELPELLDGDLGAADPRQARAAKALENVADAPDREADRDQAEHDAHDDPAEPIGGGGADTSKHGVVFRVIECAGGRFAPAPARRYGHPRLDFVLGHEIAPRRRRTNLTIGIHEGFRCSCEDGQW